MSKMLTTYPEFVAYGGALADTFDALRPVSMSRVVRWHPGGVTDWTRNQWAVAVIGELGEAMNIVKKLNRDADGIVGNTVSRAELIMSLGEELADVLIYLDLHAYRIGYPAFGKAIRIASSFVVDRMALPQPDPASDIAWNVSREIMSALENGDIYTRAIATVAALAIKFDIDLSDEIADKFDKVSIKHGFPERLVVPSLDFSGDDPADIDTKF